MSDYVCDDCRKNPCECVPLTKIVACRIYAMQQQDGVCPVHGESDCLRTYGHAKGAVEVEVVGKYLDDYVVEAQSSLDIWTRYLLIPLEGEGE